MDNIDFDDDEIRDAFVDSHLGAIEVVRKWRPFTRGRGDALERDVNDLDAARRQLADAWAEEDEHQFEVCRIDIVLILDDLRNTDQA